MYQHHNLVKYLLKHVKVYKLLCVKRFYPFNERLSCCTPSAQLFTDVPRQTIGRIFGGKAAHEECSCLTLEDGIGSVS
jgi:hypothetical protein